MAMNGEPLNRVLSHVPLSFRSEVREFASLDLDEQLVRLYVKLHETNQEVCSIKRERSGLLGHLAQAGYTTLLAGSVIAYLITGGQIR